MPTTILNDSIHSTASSSLVTRNRDRQQFRDEDVVGLSVSSQLKSDVMGNIVLNRTITVRVAHRSGQRSVSMEAEVGPWNDDPLLDVRQRLLDNLFDRSWKSLMSGGDVAGDGWSLNLIEFSDVASRRSFPPQEIAFAGWRDDYLCLIHEDEEEPFARYRADAENTWLLLRLLGQLVEDTSQADKDVSSQFLGPLIHEASAVIIRWLAPRRVAVMTSVPIAVLLVALPLPAATMGIVLLLIAFLASIPLQTATPAKLTYFRQALVWTRGSDEATLLSEQIDSMAVRRSTQTLFDGTTMPHVDIVFGSDRHGFRNIHFATVLTQDNRGALESLIADISDRLSVALHRELSEAGRVAWTDALTILPDAVLFRREGESEDTGRILRKSDLREWSISDSTMVWVVADGSVHSETTDGPNFLPGLKLLRDRGWMCPK